LIVAAADPLDAIKIVSPCTVPWASMRGDERIRFCGKCRKSVYNLAAMTSREARKLIEEAEGHGLCLRLARRSDGTIVTGDCRARLRAARQRGTFAFACTLLAVLVVQIWAQAFGLRLLSTLLLRGRDTSPTQTVIEPSPSVHPRTAARARLPVVRHEVGGI